jgi:hypothetical protein
MLEQIVSEIGIESEAIAGFFLGGALVALIFSIFIIAVLFIAAIYIYIALAYKEIAKKLKFKKSWLAWIPIAQWAMLLQLGGFHWAWIFLLLIPILGWIAVFVLLIIAHWRIFEKLKHPGWFSLSIIIPQIGFILYAIAIGFAAWSKKK